MSLLHEFPFPVKFPSAHKILQMADELQHFDYLAQTFPQILHINMMNSQSPRNDRLWNQTILLDWQHIAKTLWCCCWYDKRYWIVSKLMIMVSLNIWIISKLKWKSSVKYLWNGNCVASISVQTDFGWCLAKATNAFKTPVFALGVVQSLTA